ncbi:UDP-N-acetylglucosamine 1-carboxyvinyltransferase [Jannaschia marina]|uniref:UDP-N-acetylglucosamine 1-carboxyvinyltransferase n=1 Tax=Jannaschia marina TaxID=2741674 RepID=UPI0015CDF0D6|nr:UDP-N-acetylglucosamine 1-carboxyvinyltransferase [Jannaschia marina]
MSSLIVRGNKRLSGDLAVSGNKNAALPMMCASLLTEETVTLTNFPPISDGRKIATFFEQLGSRAVIDRIRHEVTLDHAALRADATGDVPSGIRSAVLLIAPIVHRFGQFAIDLGSKGCALGIREIDPHLLIARAFGCEVEIDGGLCTIEGGPKSQGADIWLDYQSVTATETFALFAASRPARSVLTNAASEPHVRHLCEMLVSMGARIEGIGTSRLVIEGTDRLVGGRFAVIDDHHEVATYAAIGAATGSTLTIRSSVTADMELIVRQFRKVGLNVRIEGDAVLTGPSDFRVERPLTPEGITKIEAAPWPYFPADILPQIIGASIQAKGEVLFWNKVYEGALFWSAELAKLGARTNLSDPHRLLLMRAEELRPNVVEAPYIIRVVVGLLIAAMQIEGRSVIRNADPLDRAHPDLIAKLRGVGADLEWSDT